MLTTVINCADHCNHHGSVDDDGDDDDVDARQNVTDSVFEIF